MRVIPRAGSNPAYNPVYNYTGSPLSPGHPGGNGGVEYAYIDAREAGNGATYNMLYGPYAVMTPPQPHQESPTGSGDPIAASQTGSDIQGGPETTSTASWHTTTANTWGTHGSTLEHHQQQQQYTISMASFANPAEAELALTGRTPINFPNIFCCINLT